MVEEAVLVEGALAPFSEGSPNTTVQVQSTASGYEPRVNYNDIVENVGKSIDGLGVAIVAVGVVGALGAFALERRKERLVEDAYQAVRRRVGRAVLLGLELLVAGDLIRTVVVSPTFRSVGVLAIIVALRTFLSWSLDIEITGRPPWSRRMSKPDTS